MLPLALILLGLGQSSDIVAHSALVLADLMRHGLQGMLQILDLGDALHWRLDSREVTPGQTAGLAPQRLQRSYDGLKPNKDGRQRGDR